MVVISGLRSPICMEVIGSSTAKLKGSWLGRSTLLISPQEIFTEFPDALGYFRALYETGMAPETE